MKANNSSKAVIVKYQYIDSLRGIAILAVLLTHCQLYGTNNYSPAFKSFLDHGTLGVQLFFIISAFTLCLSFANRKSTEKHPIINFYIRRLFRIVPLFYLAILFYIFYFNSQDRLLLGMPISINLATIFSYFTFTHGVSPYWINTLVPGGWSIAVEMSFYLLFPLLFFKIRNFRVSLWTGLISAIIYQIFYSFLIKHPPISSPGLWQDYLYYFFPSQFSVFLVGFCLYHLSKSKLARFRPTTSDILLGQLFILLLIIQLTTQTLLPYHFVFSVLFGIQIYLLSLYPTKLIVNKVTAFIGKISFSLYVSHFAILKLMDSNKLVDFVNPSLLNFAIRYSLLLTLCVCISAITYYLVEVPGINLGKKIINHFDPISTPK